MLLGVFLTNTNGLNLDTGLGYSHTNGRPGCRLTEEFGRKWRNNFDPIRYWVCEGNTAVSYICPVEHMYFDECQGCMHWTHWFWTPPYDPLTHGY